MNESAESCLILAVYAIEEVEHVDIFLMLNILFNVVLAITATLWNGMIIIAIMRSQNLQTPSYLLITSLALTDLLVGLVYYPLGIVYSIFLLRNNVINNNVCDMRLAFNIFSTFLGNLTFITVTCISIDRYLALRLRHRYRVIVTKKRVRLLIVLVWMLGLCISFFLYMVSSFRFQVSTFLTLACLLITCAFYIKSFRILRLRIRQVHAQQAIPMHGNFDVVTYRKSLKTMLIILASFLLCFVPVVCSRVLLIYLGFREETIIFLLVSFTLLGLHRLV
jgi:hypothetical protein